MTEVIKQCQKCNLCKNQRPLLDIEQNCQIFWVGLSAKKTQSNNERPLSLNTNSGKILHSGEEKCGNIVTYKTNLVKCLPLTDEKKLRYPTVREIDCCYDNLMVEIKALSPHIVFLLGEKVCAAVEKHLTIQLPKWEGYSYNYLTYEGIHYVPIQHPSYIYVYRRNKMDDYINGIKIVIDRLL